MEEQQVKYDAFDAYLEDLELKLFEALQVVPKLSSTETDESESTS